MGEGEWAASMIVPPVEMVMSVLEEKISPRFDASRGKNNWDYLVSKISEGWVLNKQNHSRAGRHSISQICTFHGLLGHTNEVGDKTTPPSAVKTYHSKSSTTIDGLITNSDRDQFSQGVMESPCRDSPRQGEDGLQEGVDGRAVLDGLGSWGKKQQTFGGYITFF
jgi:hypothetical protein